MIADEIEYFWRDLLKHSPRSPRKSNEKEGRIVCRVDLIDYILADLKLDAEGVFADPAEQVQIASGPNQNIK